MKKIFFLLVLLVPLFLFVMMGKTKAAPPPNFQTTQIIGSGIDVTTGFEFAPDGRIFILERTGTVKIYKNGALLPTPFAQLNSVTTGDRGLTGIAFDPDFNNNHYVYFYFTGSDNFNRLVRLDATGDTASGAPVILYKTNTPSFELHIGGTIRFGPDGKLYVSIGDNGIGSNAQDLTTPFGKILRLNKDGSVPNDNPFIGQAGKLPEIWAYGLRNPFRFQFDSANGKMYLGDVGNDTTEEVNIITKGGNYGWPTCEGSCSTPGFINPIYTYPHGGTSSSITGGFVYRGNMFPATYQGRYFFTDYARGFMKTLTLDANGASTGVSDFDLSVGSAVDLKVAPDGSVYYITYFPARLYRITYSTVNQVPTVKSSSDTTSGNPPLTVQFSSSGSSDPDGTQLTYNWDFGDGTNSTEANPTKTYNNKGRFIVELTVSDGVNSAQATPIVMQVGTPPTVNISTPANNSTYKAGDTITYSASGADSGGNPLPDSAFVTEILFHHDTHTHPFLGPIQQKSGQFEIPISGEADPDVFFEIKITGTDSDGLKTTSSVNINPQKVNVTFNTNPANLQILLDDIPTDMPLSVDQVVGFERNISVPVMHEIAGQPYIFASWSDGGTINHDIKVPSSPVTYTANFSPLPPFSGQYFNNKTLTGTPVLTRQDKEIDFQWGESSPGTGVTPDNFSVRWTNNVFFSAGKYRFTTTSDDGVRLYIDNQLVIDKWINQSATSYTADVDLTSGNHAIKLEYYDGVYDARAELTWALLLNQNTPPTITPTPTNTPTPTPTQGSTPTPTPTPILTGYKGEYWNTPGAGTAPTFPSGAPNLTRNDAAINFNWGEGSPGTGININNFVVRWTKQQDFTAGTYRFTTTSDDGMRVYVDNQLIIDKWIDQSATTFSADKALSAGTHALKIEYYDNSVDAYAQFGFTKLSSATPTPTPSPTPTPTPSPTNTPTPTPTKTPTPIPTNTPTPTPTPSTQVNGLTGEYFDNINFTTPKLKRVDPTVNFSWGTGSPNTAIGADTFSVRWTGQVQPQYSQTYTFYTATDDGVRLWVNNQLIIDKWINQSAREWSGTINLVANQKYELRMEYFENSVDAVARLSWSSPSRSKQIIPQARLFTTNP